MSFDIKNQDHFKLYVLVQDRFTFETELQKKEIEFYMDTDEQVDVSKSIRYFLKSEDRLEIDKVVVKNQINTGIESTGVTNFDFNIKPFRLLIGIIFIVIIAILLIEYFL